MLLAGDVASALAEQSHTPPREARRLRRDARRGERWLRALAMASGVILALSSATLGVDGLLAATAGTLIGFGVGRGLR